MTQDLHTVCNTCKVSEASGIYILLEERKLMHKRGQRKKGKGAVKSSNKDKFLKKLHHTLHATNPHVLQAMRYKK